METILLLILTAAVAWLVFQYQKSKGGGDDLDAIKARAVTLESQLTTADQKIGELKQLLTSAQDEKNEFAGKNKQLWAQLTELKEEQKSVSKERDDVLKRIAKFEAEEKQRRKTFEEKIEQLNGAKLTLDDEKKRIRKEDEERQAHLISERDRMWAEHEERVIQYLSELCKISEFQFAGFDNKNLPEGFDGTLKPDFLIEFLGQYIVFDAKISRSDNLQIYLATQVKSTVTKIQKRRESIYPTVFFVVPTDAISLLKKLYYYEGGYSFYIISPESLAPILAQLKRITTYEFAEQLDPQERENIVGLLAELDFHINFRNAADLLLVQSGVNTLEKAHALSSGIQEAIEQKKDKMRLANLSPSEVKRLMMDRTKQQDAVRNLVAPKVTVPKRHVDEAAEIFEA